MDILVVVRAHCKLASQNITIHTLKTGQTAIIIIMLDINECEVYSDECQPSVETSQGPMFVAVILDLLLLWMEEAVVVRFLVQLPL